MCACVVKITFPSELHVLRMFITQVISLATIRVQTRVKRFIYKNHASRVGEKNYRNKMTDVRQNPTSLLALSHTICVAHVNFTAFMSSVNIVSIVNVQ